MLQTFRNAWRIEELRKKILFTLLIVLLYRLGNAVPVPFVDTNLLQQYFNSSNLQNTIFGLYNVMSGGAFSRATIFALSIQPYINASIIIQLLCIAISPLWSACRRRAVRKAARRSPPSPVTAPWSSVSSRALPTT